MSVTEKYVEFLYPGIFMADSSTKLLADGEAIELPERAVGYRTFERTATTVDGEVLRGANKNVSPWTYAGREMTLDDVRRELPDERILISNMQGNGYDRVVMFPNGQTYQLHAGDTVISR